MSIYCRVAHNGHIFVLWWGSHFIRSLDVLQCVSKWDFPKWIYILLRSEWDFLLRSLISTAVYANLNSTYEQHMNIYKACCHTCDWPYLGQIIPGTDHTWDRSYLGQTVVDSSLSDLLWPVERLLVTPSSSLWGAVRGFISASAPVIRALIDCDSLPYSLTSSHATCILSL